MLQRKISLVLALAMLAVPVMAQETKQPSAAQAAQQQKMTDCNAQAKTKNLAGDERKKFMSSCLSAKPATATSGNSQQQKMKDCNAQATAKSLKGDERKTFMSTCLSGSTK
ncbi:MAG TPA: PsiF family protein [Terriglobales bacterium]